MGSNSDCQQQLIHFSRWSRKSYAVFQSFGKQVVIDHLKAEVCGSGVLQKEFETEHYQDENVQDNNVENKSQYSENFMTDDTVVEPVSFIEEIMFD
ncbi:MAG: hypothetical protein C0594_11370 [Marinilabiliales bacterium]|nr:MAG: hypothetical protein C0594_11370 [Marinilabiliales bacterium]